MASSADTSDFQSSSQPLTICCKHCDMKFSTKQALGGHQNAHRVDQAVAKELQHVLGAWQPHNPFKILQDRSQQEQCPVGLCLFCMKSAALKVCIDCPSLDACTSSLPENMRRVQRPPQQLTTRKRRQASNSSNLVSTSRARASPGYYYSKFKHGVEAAGTRNEKRVAAPEMDAGKKSPDLSLRLWR